MHEKQSFVLTLNLLHADLFDTHSSYVTQYYFKTSLQFKTKLKISNGQLLIHLAIFISYLFDIEKPTTSRERERGDSKIDL